MTHYDLVEWTLYKKDLLHENIKEEMENHLLECDDCMDAFLSIIDRELEDGFEHIAKLSEDFTDEVINKIQTKEKTDKDEKPLSKNLIIDNRVKTNKIKKAKKKKNIYNEFLVYYMAVASVAIFLTASGFFTTIANRTPEFGEKLIASKKEVKVDSVYRFSQNITDATSSFVHNFNIKEKENR